MLIRFILALLLVLPLAAPCQTGSARVDSLLQVLKTAKPAEKVDILLELSKDMLREEQGLAYANQALEIAEKSKDKKKQAEALTAIGRCYYATFKDSLAIENLSKSLEISKSLNDKPNILKGLKNIANVYYYVNIEESKSYTTQAIELSIEINDNEEHADALLILALILDKEYKQEEALKTIYQALELITEQGKPENLVAAYAALGRQYFNMGNYQKSIEYYRKEIEIKERTNDYFGLLSSHHNLGRTHRTIGNYQLAIEQYQKSLRYSEQLNDKYSVATNNSEIGLVYESLCRSDVNVVENEQNYRKALSYHEEALKIYRELDDKRKIAEALNNIANNNSHLAVNQFISKYKEFWEDSLEQFPPNVIVSSFGKAFDYYKQALVIFEELQEVENNVEKEIINVNINLGSHYIYARDWRKVTQHLNRAYTLARKANSQPDIALVQLYFGEYYYRLKDYENSEQNLIQSLRISTGLGIKDLMRYVNKKLSRIYELKGNYVLALKHEKEFNRIKDEMFSEESQKIITEMQTKYETDKKEQEIKLLNNERELQHSVIQRQRLTLAVTVGGLLVILAFAGLLVNMVRQKQKANRILEEKNELISHQKQEITDSIRYASRIQSAVLPQPSILGEALKDHFVLFLPRDIVSGDFYWFTKQQNKMILVAADCTGHGVPGAFMSMLGVSFLYEIVNKEGVMQPAKILDMLRELVKFTLSQTGKKDEQKDGMDISLSMLDLENMKLEWAGAYNPLILIRNNEVIEYKADKMPVAIHLTDHKPFTNNEINLQPDDRFYMFSDGFPDQFGGEEGRKYMSKRFKNFLLEIHQKPMEEQKELLHKEHLSWRGATEQIDDIVVFGVRV